jgi:predicted acetyltransferase
MLIQSESKVISALQLIPYPMTFCGATIHTSYISGACTHPGYRGKGMMRELLLRTFTRMYAEGFFISALIPENLRLTEYYARMGYASVFRYSRRTLRPAEFPEAGKNVRIMEQTIEVREDIYRYVSRKMSERPCCIQHTKADFEVVLADLFLSKGCVFFAVGEKGEIEGVAFVIAEGDTLYVNELLSDNVEAENELLKQAAVRRQCNQIVITCPPEKASERFPFGMARIINAKEVLTLYAAAHPEIETVIDLYDAELCANRSCYSIQNGKCTIIGRDKLPETSVQLDIRELTEKVLEGMYPYMSLMIN